MTIIYSIDGNIGSGKSTFVTALKEYFSLPENCQWCPHKKRTWFYELLLKNLF